MVAVVAAPTRADRAVETWIGTWSGKASWKGCSVEGPATIEVQVAWHDGAAWIDAAAIYDGLDEVVAETSARGVLRYGDDDSSITFVRKQGSTTLRFETAAHCTMTARVERAGTGIDGCDRLVALAVAAHGCGLTVEDDPASEIDAWSALTRKHRARAGTACARRADVLRARLVAEACIPPDNDPADLPACRAVWKAAERMVRCDHAPVEIKQRTLESIADLRRSLRAYAEREGARDLAATTCTETAEILRERLDILHCP